MTDTKENKRGPVRLFFMCYFSPYVSFHDTLVEAMRQAESLLSANTGNPEWIVDADGTEYDRNAILDWNCEWERVQPPRPASPPSEHVTFKDERWQIYDRH